MGEFKEQGPPTWEERFLDVDVVVRAKLVSSRPRIAGIWEGKYSGRHYPAIETIFRVSEVFKGSVYADYVVGWDYYGSYSDAECVRPDSIASLRQDDPYLDDREAVLLLKRIGDVEGFENISASFDKIASSRAHNFIARLPSEKKSPSLLEDEQWRWLPLYERDASSTGSIPRIAQAMRPKAPSRRRNSEKSATRSKSYTAPVECRFDGVSAES